MGSGQAAQELQEAKKLHAQLLVFSCIKFLILISQLSCSRAMERVLDLQDHGIDDFSNFENSFTVAAAPTWATWGPWGLRKISTLVGSRQIAGYSAGQSHHGAAYSAAH